MPIEEPMEEEEAVEEVAMGETPPTGDSVPERAPAPWVTLPAETGFWAGDPSDQMAGREVATSLWTRGKVPAI